MSALLVRTSTGHAPPTLVTVTGEIDIATAPSLRRHLLPLPDCSTILDLSGVRLLSAAGLTELVDLRERLIRTDACLALAAARPLVQRVLVITGLADTVTVAGTLDEAVYLLCCGVDPVVRSTPPPSCEHEHRGARGNARCCSSAPGRDSP